VACLSGNTFSVEAKWFILAAGGIENPRLLLLSNKKQPAGLGNQHDLVGRFFMEHPRFVAGIFLPSDPRLSLRFYKTHLEHGSFIKGYLRLPPDIQRSEKLADVLVRLDPVYDKSVVKSSESEGVHAVKTLAKQLQHAHIPEDFGKHVGNIIGDIDGIIASAYTWARFRGAYPLDHIKLTTRVEQAPNPESRVTLTTERDRLGLNRVQLDWRLSPIDIYSARRTLEIVGAELGRAGLGRLKIVLGDDDTLWPADTAGGFHHIGTTRMSDDAKQGVVDRNCQVQGISNLFIAGSSVFPTSGSGTPTLTLIALALRLTDYLKEKIK
jgi:choline dehydrogenase-like flavoprotein